MGFDALLHEQSREWLPVVGALLPAGEQQAGSDLLQVFGSPMFASPMFARGIWLAWWARCLFGLVLHLQGVHYCMTGFRLSAASRPVVAMCVRAATCPEVSCKQAACRQSLCTGCTCSAARQHTVSWLGVCCPQSPGAEGHDVFVGAPPGCLVLLVSACVGAGLGVCVLAQVPGEAGGM